MSSPSNSIPSSSPPTKSTNLLQDISQPSHQTEDGEVTKAEDLPSSAEAPTAQFLLQRISALEAYVTAQDQRILHLETEIKRINGPPQHYPVESHPVIKDLQAKITAIASATPKTSYRDAAAKRLPDLASAVLKEQAERLKRSKSLVIRDRNPDPPALHHSAGPYDHEQKESLCTWLSLHGLTPAELTGLSARLIPTRPDLSNPTAISPPSHSRGITIIVTLPSMTDRTQTVAKLKRSVRSSPNGEFVFIDPDLTPTEAKEQQVLRQERNHLNAQRQAEDIATYHFGIRSGRVVKDLH